MTNFCPVNQGGTNFWPKCNCQDFTRLTRYQKLDVYGFILRISRNSFLSKRALGKEVIFFILNSLSLVKAGLVPSPRYNP